MALTNYAIGGTSANKGGTQTIQLQDSAERSRYYLLSQYMEGATGANGFTAARTGVITSGSLDNTTNIPNALQISASGSGLNVSIAKGAAIVERSTSLNGTYRVASYATGTVTLGTADATNDRLDGIYLQVLDGAVGDNGGVSLTQFIVVPGTGTPVAGVIPLAAAPANSIFLGHVQLTHGASTVTGAMVHDDRKSTALKGGIRVLLPGDSVNDPGFGVGEMRNTIVVSATPSVDYWSTTGTAWVRVSDLVHPPVTLIGGQKRNLTATGAITTTETTIVTSQSLNLEASTDYKITFNARGAVNSTTVERWTQRIRKTNIAGTTLAANTIAPASDSAVDAVGGHVEYIYTTTTAETGVVFLGTWVRASSTGSSTWIASTADNFITVERMAASSVMSAI